MLALIKGLDALVEVLLALVEMVFRGAYLAHALFAFAFSVLLDLECVVLGLDDSLFLQVLGLAFRVGEGEFCFIGRCVVTILQDLLHEKVTYRETDNDRYDGSDDDLDHSIPFRSSCISRYERWDIKNALTYRARARLNDCASLFTFSKIKKYLKRYISSSESMITEIPTFDRHYLFKDKSRRRPLD